jgi:hypothetical protein
MKLTSSFLAFFICIFLNFTYATPNWMVEQIQEDLNPYKVDKISRSSILKIFKESQESNQSNYFVLFELRDGQLSATSDNEQTQKFHHFDHLVSTLRDLIKGSNLPDLIFIMSLHDGWNKTLAVPVFSPCGFKGVPGTICIPDFEALGQRLGTKKEVEKGEISWRKKIARGFWRGSTTGGNFTKSNCYDKPRSKLVIHSIQNPRFLDARFTHYCQFEQPSFIREFQEKCPGAPRASIRQHQRYRYLIDVDGNACSWSRMYWILLSRSVLLKQESPWYQWYYKAIKPWEHYIPLKNDVEDVVDKIIWAKQNDKKARRIAQNATDIVEEIFSKDAVQTYVVMLLKSYAECLNNDE